MDLQKWWDEEGSVMHERGCSIDVIANAAWNAATLLEREACASLMSDASLEATAERYERFARYSAECAEIIRARSNVELRGRAL